MPAIPKTPVTKEVIIFTGKNTPKIEPKKLKNKSIIKPTNEFSTNFKSNLKDLPKSHKINIRIKIAIINEKVPSIM